MKNITLSAREELIEAARARARAEQTTLNAAFRDWLESYTHQGQALARYDHTVEALRGKMRVGHALTRDEMHAR